MYSAHVRLTHFLCNYFQTKEREKTFILHKHTAEGKS